MDLKERLKQAEADRDGIQKNINDLKKLINESKVPSSVDIYYHEVEVGITGNYICVYGKNVQSSTSKVKGYPITVKEAKKMVVALNTMIDYLESNND